MRLALHEEVDFKSSSGYLALLFMFIALIAIPLSIMARFPPVMICSRCSPSFSSRKACTCCSRTSRR